MPTTDAIRSGDELVIGTKAGASKSWNWHPDIPIRYSPLFTFPPESGSNRYMVRARLVAANRTDLLPAAGDRRLVLGAAAAGPDSEACRRMGRRIMAT